MADPLDGALRERLGLETSSAALQRVLAAVRAKLAAGYVLPLTPTPDEQAAWDEATLLSASRLFKRRTTPEGLSFGDFGVIRVGRFDADVEDLLAPFRRWVLA